MRYGFFCALLTGAALTGTGRAQTIVITIEGGKQDLKASVPICVPLSLTKDEASRIPMDRVLKLFVKGRSRWLEAQLTGPSLTTRDRATERAFPTPRDLHFILPGLKAGAKLTLHCDLNAGTDSGAPCFRWKSNESGLSGDLVYDDGKHTRPVLRYMGARYDNSTPEKRKRTYKVFHHLYDPAGTRFVTNGGHNDPYTDEKKLLYPHHRGLMYAFNKISYGDGLKQNADTWHAQPGDTHQETVGIHDMGAGRVLGRHVVDVNWLGPKGENIVVEQRELTVYNVPGGRLVEFASWLAPSPSLNGGTVRLDGDPQHAGFQFRASNEVAEKTAKQTYYLRPDGKGGLGETRNWEPKTKQGPVDLPWDAMSFVLGGKRYTVAYLNSPTNPTPSRFSERDYGRFGCYFEHDLTAKNPLVVNYRVWLQDSEMTAEQVQALYEAFADPPRVTVKR